MNSIKILFGVKVGKKRRLQVAGLVVSAGGRGGFVGMLLGATFDGGG
jgi:hypothetical protein